MKLLDKWLDLAERLCPWAEKHSYVLMVSPSNSTLILIAADGNDSLVDLHWAKLSGSWTTQSIILETIFGRGVSGRVSRSTGLTCMLSSPGKPASLSITSESQEREYRHLNSTVHSLEAEDFHRAFARSCIRSTVSPIPFSVCVTCCLRERNVYALEC